MSMGMGMLGEGEGEGWIWDNNRVKGRVMLVGAGGRGGSCFYNIGVRQSNFVFNKCSSATQFWIHLRREVKLCRVVAFPGGGFFGVIIYLSMISYRYEQYFCLKTIDCENLS